LPVYTARVETMIKAFGMSKIQDSTQESLKFYSWNFETRR